MNMKYIKNAANIMRNNLIYILIILIAFIIMRVNLPYSIYSPGGIINVNERLSNAEHKSKGTFNMTYVTTRTCNITTCLIGLIMPEWDIVSNNNQKLDNETLKDSYSRERTYLYESISNATYVAYLSAGIDIEVEKTNLYVTFLLDYGTTNLKVGDKIIKINNKTMNSYDDILKTINENKVGSKLEFTVIRDDKEIKCSAEIKDIDGNKKVGMGISTINEYKKNPNISYKIKSSEYGSSGGLIIALSIYDALTENDLSKGLKISGTGTISSDGTVGSISGVKYKLSGAVKKKSDVFLVPADNYDEAIELKKKYNYDIKIIKAENFNQVLAELNKL